MDLYIKHNGTTKEVSPDEYFERLKYLDSLGTSYTEEIYYLSNARILEY